ncbi:hypothetical protein DPMN_189584 [Dreissena polymorpha]|uniref:Uncharacterized protein n=2 Tax=Dreissena polymorpha TaxID=45954 RepID=A0A9D4DSR1_DREPO|nr:hypothetical protein DPMN_189584 [Dreissena polymorpha]
MSVKVRLTATIQQVSSSTYVCESASCSVKLTRNEHVWVMKAQQSIASQIYETGNSWNSFTGTLIQEL